LLSKLPSLLCQRIDQKLGSRARRRRVLAGDQLACSVDAKAILRPVYDRFTEGFDTADLNAAKALLDALR